MDHAFFRAQPAQLRIGREPPPEPGKVGGHVSQRQPDDEVAERFDRRDAHLVAAADRERQTVSLETGVGSKDHIRGGIVGIDVHGVGPVMGSRRRKSQVEDVEADNLHRCRASRSDTEAAEDTE